MLFHVVIQIASQKIHIKTKSQKFITLANTRQ